MKWLSTKTHKPHLDNKDEWCKEHKESVRVLVWIDTFDYAFFGTYYHKSGNWGIEGTSGIHSDRIVYFAYINAPTKLLKNKVVK